MGLLQIDNWSGERRWPVNFLLAVSATLFVVGITAPLMTVRQFFIFSDTVSLISALHTLLEGEQLALFALIFGFSIVFPLVKLVLLARIWNERPADGERHRRHLAILARYGKWSMLDVFVVAVLVVLMKLNLVADIQVRFGLYAFMVSVILTMLVTGWISRQVHHPAGGRDAQQRASVPE